jgi:hypothetical protein
MAWHVKEKAAGEHRTAGRGRWRLGLPLAVVMLGSATGLALIGPGSASAVPVVTTGGSEVHAVIQVETSPAYADDPVIITSSQLQASCGGTITFETLQRGTTAAPTTSTDFIEVNLDNDGNVTVVVDGYRCAPGSDVIEADLAVAPYLTATTQIDVQPPQVTPSGLSAYPNDEVETGDDAAVNGNSDVYTVFYVETSPVYAEDTVEISSPQLEDRCGQGWRWEPAGGTPIDQLSGPTVATGTLDDDGNAVFVFKGASCAAGDSDVIADVEAGTHPTYTTTYTIDSPAVTLPSATVMKAATAHHRRHGHKKSIGTTPPTDPPAIIVTASPDPLVESGATPPSQSALTITKTDNQGGPGIDVSCTFDIEYTITVTNTGSTTVDGAVVTDSYSGNSGEFDGDTFTSVATGGATGNSAVGTPDIGNTNYEDIDDTLDLPPGATVTYYVDATINTETSTLDNTATVTPPGGPPQSASDNNTFNFDFSDC